MRIVLDTNVLVSGLYNPNGAPGRIIDLILGARIRVLYDDRILAEYRDVLARPQLAIEPSVAQAVVGHIRLSGEPIMALPFDKDNDLPFVEVAITGKTDMLVTGNMKHFSMLKERGMTVLSPAQCLERFL